MNTVPKSLRLHIAILGRTNVGKSSIINALTNRDTAIVSEVAGTTTDPVEKTMEIAGIGPVLLIDTAGFEDQSTLGALRIEKTRIALNKTDLALIVSDGLWTDMEREILRELESRKISSIVVLHKSDIRVSKSEVISNLIAQKIPFVQTSIKNPQSIKMLLAAIVQHAPKEKFQPQQILQGLIKAYEHVVMVTPIDIGAPVGRLILPQVQTIRDALDHQAICTITTTEQLSKALSLLKSSPDLVITDSQAFYEVSQIISPETPLTSFSILFARLKADLEVLVEGSRVIEELKVGDKIIIAEACTHHPSDEDIGRVKIPNLLYKKLGFKPHIEFMQSSSFPKNIDEFKLIIHCGACMWNRQQMLSQVFNAQSYGIPMTNYGMAIAACLGILERALKPFNLDKDYESKRGHRYQER